MRRLLLGLLILRALYTQAQDNFENFVSYNTDNGMLLHNTVEAFTRDQMGYVWVGTDFGLYRLDGYHSENFNYDPSDSTSLSANIIKALCTDSDGDVWVGTIGGGLNKYDRTTNRFIRYLPNNSANSISSLNISALTQDDDGNIWIGTLGKGVNKFDKATGKFTAFNLVKYDPENRVNSNVSVLFCDKDGDIWIGKNQGEVYKINSKNNEITYYGIGTKNKEAIAEIGAILGITQLKNGKILFSTWNGKVYEIDPKQGRHLKLYKTPAFFENNILTNIAVDKDDNIWIGTWSDGIYKTSYNSTQKVHFIRDSKKKNTLISNAINKLFVDQDQNLWICFLDKGLGLTSLKPNMINPVEITNEQTEYINAFSIIKDWRGNIWIGSRGQGIWKYNPKNEQTKCYTTPKTSDLDTRSILVMKLSTKGKILIGTDGSFVAIYDPDTDQFVHVPNKKEDWSSSVFALTDDQQYIYAGTWGGGIKKIDKKSLSYTTIDFDKKDQFRNTVFDLELVDSILWVSNIGIGLIKYNVNTGNYITYTHSDQRPDFPSERITAIYVENKNSLYLSTDGAGLFHFIPSTGKVSSVLPQYDVHINNIQASISDKNKNLWITSNSGLVQINTKMHSAFTFNTNNGLYSEQLNMGALFYDAKMDRIYTGSIEGVNYFSPENIIIDSAVNKVILTRLEIMGKSIQYPNNHNIYKAINVADTLHLFYNEKTLTIHFSSMEIMPSLKSKYFYKLEGFNKGWIELPYSKNFVHYTNLYPGEYTLKLKACNSDGICGDQETKLTIIVHPAFWQTLLFKILVVLAVISLISFYTLEKYQRLIKSKKELEEKVTERTREILLQKERIEKQNTDLELANNTKNKFFSIISHDLRNPLASINQLAELITMQYKKASKEKIEQLLNLLRSSSNNAIELLDDLLIWASTQTNRIKVKLKNILVSDLIKETMNICQPVADKKEIRIKYPSTEELKVFADKNTILTVLRNLVTNAIKFSPTKSKIELKVQEKNDTVVIKVIDQGVGMTSTEIENLFKIENLSSKEGTSGETGTGLGLILCSEFLNLNNGHIWVESEKGKGSTFYFSLEKA